MPGSPRRRHREHSVVGEVLRRGVAPFLSLYLLLALVNRLAERLGVVRCGCASDCWCRRPGLSLFRWVFPWRHRGARTPEEKAALEHSSV